MHMNVLVFFACVLLNCFVCSQNSESSDEVTVSYSNTNVNTFLEQENEITKHTDDFTETVPKVTITNEDITTNETTRFEDISLSYSTRVPEETTVFSTEYTSQNNGDESSTPFGPTDFNSQSTDKSYGSETTNIEFSSGHTTTIYPDISSNFLHENQISKKAHINGNEARAPHQVTLFEQIESTTENVDVNVETTWEINLNTVLPTEIITEGSPIQIITRILPQTHPTKLPSTNMVKEYSREDEEQSELKKIAISSAEKIANKIVADIKNSILNTSIHSTGSIPTDESTSFSYDDVSSGCEVKNLSLAKIEIDKTEITTKWRIEMLHSTSNICQLHIFMECKSLNKTNLEWRILSQRIEMEVIETDPIVTLQNVSEYTTYNCTCGLTNQAGIQESFIITTLEEVPSEIHFFATEIGPTNFTLEWEKPYKIPGTLKKYHILIDKLGPKHYVREECESNYGPYAYSFYSPNNELSWDIDDDVEPNNEYEVQILAEDEAGNSTGIRRIITTKSWYSTMPLNATSKITEYSDGCDGQEYNMSLLITWELPCNTNGELIEFEVEITSQERRNNQNYKTDWSYIYSKEIENNTAIYYELYLNNINASNIYTSKITPISKNGLRGNYVRVNSDQVPEGCPLPPNNIIVNNIGPTNFTITWSEPEIFVGDISAYTIEIKSLYPEHFVSRDKDCPASYPQQYELSTYATNIKFDHGFPNLNYSIRIKSNTSRGFGDYSEFIYVKTLEKESDPVRDMTLLKGQSIISKDQYEYKIAVKFKEPCSTNGPFESYVITGKGHRDGGTDEDFQLFPIKYPNITRHVFSLTKPEYNYVFEVQVVTGSRRTSEIATGRIRTSAGIPPLNIEGFKYSTNENDRSQIDVVLNKNISNDANGKVLYYAVILMRCLDENFARNDTSFGLWNGTWFSPSEHLNFNERQATGIVQLTSNFLNPFKDGANELRFSIGKTVDCGTNDYCEPLLEETTYIMVFRSLTQSTYSDVYTVIKTGSSGHLGSSIVLIILLLFIIFGVVVLFLMRKRKIWVFNSVTQVSIVGNEPRYNIPAKHFISYYNKVLNDPTLLKKQYDDIEDEIQLYKQSCVNITFATKPENKRKNRYTNILPYDEYRVKLQIEEDDEMSSDYINASYIKGYSNKVEYIATQGPLEHTCKDFWKMVVQENVNVIVMVSQFIEKEKEKCFKYFPNNHENMLICEEVEVKCLTELQFDTYCIRTLLVRKDLIQKSVVHVQYLEWPDFGCPEGTRDILYFCKEVRDRIELEKGLMIVHCSAGVGRTGTLISLDILLQTLKKKEEISIFETVMELRRQRTHMVQTEKQYVFIHTCIKDALENTKLYLSDDLKKSEEHTYANTIVPKSSCSKSKLNESVF